ncbi:hypothetical protein ISF6_1283 [Piscinibacter sakaiensis]|uniref:Peptidase M48 domain-containing protein n=2 Tax=Piscinibacter sakaiensis TaxID=1547922 RepID=A0A0K8P006_PISS1|nr:hypothetical protein ISF6_1283 [Piscinibacter sakaiensis]
MTIETASAGAGMAGGPLAGQRLDHRRRRAHWRGRLGTVVLVLAAGWGGSVPAAAEGIVDVLQRSQQQRLDWLTRREAPDPVASARIQASFDAVLAAAPTPVPARLRVVHGGEVLAETVLGQVIVADATLAALPEGERCFVLAHELGHVALAHWARMGELYAAHLPGEVMRFRTEAVAGLLGADASGLAHRQEHEADAYGLALLRRLGHGPQDALALFMRLGARPDTPTHPATRKRVARLRAVDGGEAAGAAGPAANGEPGAAGADPRLAPGTERPDAGTPAPR